MGRFVRGSDSQSTADSFAEAVLKGILDLKSMGVMTSNSVYLREIVVKAMTIKPQSIQRFGGRSDGTDTDVVGFIGIIRRNLGRILLATLATLALAGAYLATTVPLYTATATVLIDPRQRKTVENEVVIGGLGSDLALVESQVPVISSDTVLKRAVESLSKDPNTDFRPQGSQTGPLEKVKEMIRGPRPVPEPFGAALEELKRCLIVKRAPKTYVVDIEVTTASPERSAAAANAIAEAYKSDQQAAKTDEAVRANQMIDARLGELTEQVRRGEIRIDDFKKANKIVSSEGGSLNEQQLGKLSSELASARAVAAEAKARLEQTNQILKGKSSADLLPEAMKSPVIQRLREQSAQVSRREAALSSQLQSKHPVLVEVRSQMKEINNQIQAELVRVSQSAKGESAVATAREKELVRIIEEAKADVGRTNTAQIKLRELEREVEASRDLLKAFLARAKETQEQKNLSTAEARVISEATPPNRPSKPGRILILSLALLSGLGLGITHALLRDQMRRSRLRAQDGEADAEPTQQRVSAEFEADASVSRRTTTPRGRSIAPRQALFNELPNLPALANSTQPRALASGRSGQASNQASETTNVLRAVARNQNGASEPAFRQAIYRLLSRLQSGVNDGEALTLFLASAYARSGTSAAALALGCAAARNGQRVLIIDAASSEPELSEAFAPDLNPSEPVKLDSAEHLARLVQHDQTSGISVLPIALADIRTLNLNQRQRLSSGIIALAQSYDLVLIDGGAILDDDLSLSVLPAVDRIAIVARSGTTTVDDIDALSARLRPENDRLMGVTWMAA